MELLYIEDIYFFEVNIKYILSSVLKILMLFTHQLMFVCFYSKKSKFSFYISYFLEDFRYINLPCNKPIHNNIKEDKGVFVIEYVDQSRVIGTDEKKFVQRQSARHVMS